LETEHINAKKKKLFLEIQNLLKHHPWPEGTIAQLNCLTIKHDGFPIVSLVKSQDYVIWINVSSMKYVSGTDRWFEFAKRRLTFPKDQILCRAHILRLLLAARTLDSAEYRGRQWSLSKVKSSHVRQTAGILQLSPSG